MNDLFWLTIVLFFVAAALRSEVFFYLLYVIVGLQVLLRFWVRRGTRSLTWRRTAPPAAFPGDVLNVELELANNSLLPIPWLSVYESIPPALRTPPMVREVLSLGAGERRVISYSVTARQRGFYRIGPLALRTGDVLGLGEHSLAGAEPTSLTIYPTILSLGELGLPASLPFGTLASPQRLFSDPSRPAGVRPYQATDGVRRIDWKSTAHTGTPLVRRYQHAIALETLIALAFSREEYGRRYAYDLMERALTAAASIAVHLVERGQAVGFCTTGIDPASGRPAAPVSVASGRGHLIEIMGVLGRLEPAGEGKLPPLLQHASTHLGWGSTLILITGERGIELLASLLPLRQRGLNIALIITNPTPDELSLPRQHGITTYGLWKEGRPEAA